MTAGPADALSCLRPDPARSFQQAEASEQTYVIARGTLDFDGAELPEGMSTAAEDQSVSVPARLSGMGLTRDGYTVPFDRDVTLVLQCLGPWCGTATPGTEVLAFLEKDDDGYTIRQSPCGGLAFQDAPDDWYDTVATCFAGGDCTPQE